MTILALLSGLSIPWLSACESAPVEVIDRYEATLSLNSCVRERERCQSALTRSAGGCLMIRGDGEEARAPVRYEAGAISLTGALSPLSIGPGATVEASLLLFPAAPMSCAQLSVESSCEEGCVARLSQPPFEWTGGELTLNFQGEGGRCRWESPDPEVARQCVITEEVDQSLPSDMGPSHDQAPSCEEDAVRSCGACGEERCVGGAWTTCISPESCCEPDRLGEACETGLPGLCALGSIQCLDPATGEVGCAALVEPIPELCDGEDNDCDGSSDEAFTDGGQQVGERCARGDGPCRQEGSVVCLRADEARCDAVPGEPGGLDDDCDGQDDDCDTRLDEDFTPSTTRCGDGFCASEGRRICDRSEAGNQLIDTCRPGPPAAERDLVCDGFDEDCDGGIDEDFEPLITSCGRGVCLAQGLLSCEAGRLQDSCTEGSTTGEDADCDGRDQDCDGRADEHFPLRRVECGMGACSAEGQISCVTGEEQSSCRVGEPEPFDRDCDGIDDDCNGVPDDGFIPVPIQCGQGVCRANGVRRCQGGELVDDCTEGEPIALQDLTCDGVDDNCDGNTDESYIPTRSSCGRGICAAEGLVLCEGGRLRNNCTPGEQQPSDSSCNGLDEDCDGRFDEDYVSEEVSCGLGPCRTSVESSCLNGSPQVNCEPLPTPDPADLCGGGDGDCDGTVDEGFVQEMQRCGDGVCESEGVSSCVDGVYSTGCTPGPREEESDLTCDGRDGDCDGNVDEDFIETETRCGDGVCVSVGSLSCESGPPRIVDSCEEGFPTGLDSTCDGIDDDCDTRLDEAFEMRRTCGQGLCQVEVELRCEGGVIIDECESMIPAGAPSDGCGPGDEDCDGDLDEDCQDSDLDGVPDEEDNCPLFGGSPSQRNSGAGPAGDLCDWTSVTIPSGESLQILTHEVTIGAYRDCIAAGACDPPPANAVCDQRGIVSSWDAYPDNYPVTCLKLQHWQSYCGWLNAFVPTEAQIRGVFSAFPDTPFTEDCARSVLLSCGNMEQAPVCGANGERIQNGLCDFVGNLREGTESLPNNGNTTYLNCFGSFIDGQPPIGRLEYDACNYSRISRIYYPFIGFRCIKD
ncbi:MAG: MopE-related protein [Myxococcota bacterium]|nr:MopE-related protein [Myxococcota bacterium]